MSKSRPCSTGSVSRCPRRHCTRKGTQNSVSFGHHLRRFASDSAEPSPESHLRLAPVLRSIAAKAPPLGCLRSLDTDGLARHRML
eukprot:10762936-Alexandrium_andersonii.AAC.1